MIVGRTEHRRSGVDETKGSTNARRHRKRSRRGLCPRAIHQHLAAHKAAQARVRRIDSAGGQFRVAAGCAAAAEFAVALCLE